MMKTPKQPQPAKTAYFFGPGYQDIKDAIRTAWTADASTAAAWYAKYSAYGLLSLRGIFSLFCALSVVTFGTVIFLCISAVTIIVVSLCAILAWTAMGLAWGIDRLYLVMNRIFTACHICKSKYLIPVYVCPSCGVQHTSLTPGRYGILHRTCQCGQKLPCMFFNGRKRLKAVCPVCMRDWKHETILFDRESRPFCVPVVGSRSAGKTAYITAFSKLFVDVVAPAKGMEIEFYNQDKRDIYGEIKTDYTRGSTRMTARPQNMHQASSISFSFFVKHRELRPERLIHIYDIAGEVFTDNSETEVQKQYEYCQGILFIVDPFSIPSVRARYGNLLPMVDRAGIARADTSGVLDVFLGKLREVTGLSDTDVAKVPLAIVLGKTDAGGLNAHFSKERVEAVQKANPGTPLDYNDAMDFLIRQFLRENRLEGFVNSIDLRFHNNRYFAVSAIGHSRDAGAYAPVGVLEPMEWLCCMADPRFARVWGVHEFSKKLPANLVYPAFPAA